ncbi:MAG: CHASE4 domain-containing protein, partial [Roseibium sp.]|uniref:CHASE4 domain-containing protein n=1 Tax=Roseibium sp. TaxID=1936156 RepID=UPI003297BD1B
MSIQTKIITVLVVVLGGLLLGDLIVLDRVVLEGFRKLENQETRREIGRTMAIVDDEVKSLDPVASNWAQWDDLAEFAQTGNPAFAKQKLSNTVLDTLALDMVIVVNRDGRVVLNRFRNRQTGGAIRVDNLEHDDFPEDHPLLAH